MKKLSFIAALLLFSSPVLAEITFNGFASIKATTADSDGGQSPFEVLKGSGDTSFKDESLFALQASSNLTEGLSATVQFMAKGSNDFDVEAQWAYLTYVVSDIHSIQVGRLANPIFHQSEYENVGYAHNYARLPKAVYIGFSFSTIEGVAINSNYLVGDWSLETKVLYGNWSGDLYISTSDSFETFGIKNLVSLSGTLSGDWWRIFAGGFISELEGGTLDEFYLDVLSPGINAAALNGATPQEIAQFTQANLAEGKDGVYWYTGFGIDYNNFLFDVEYAEYQIEDSLDAPNDVWYVAAGYRFGDVTVTTHYEEYNHTSDYSFLDGVTDPILLATGQGFHDVLGIQNFDAVGIDIRYDFHPSAALKLDYTKGNDTRSNVGDYTIWSVGVDLIF